MRYHVRGIEPNARKTTRKAIRRLRVMRVLHPRRYRALQRRLPSILPRPIDAASLFGPIVLEDET